MANEISNANASSVVDSNGNAVEDATIIAIKQEDVAALSQSQATEIQALAKLTDVNGDFTFSVSELYSSQNQYVVVALEESGEQQGTPNYPHVDASGSTPPNIRVLRYRYEDDTNTTAIDTWDNSSYDGTISGTTSRYSSTSAEGSFALSFNGTAESVTVDNSILPAFDSGSFSVRSFVRLPSDNSGAIIDKRSGSNFDGWDLEYNSSSVRMVIDDGSATVASSTASLSTGQFYDIVGVVDRNNDQLRVYIDGSQDGQANITNANNIETTVDLGLGGRVNSSSFYLNAILDDSRIWSEALTDTQVSNLYDTGNISG